MSDDPLLAVDLDRRRVSVVLFTARKTYAQELSSVNRWKSEALSRGDMAPITAEDDDSLRAEDAASAAVVAFHVVLLQGERAQRGPAEYAALRPAE